SAPVESSRNEANSLESERFRRTISWLLEAGGMPVLDGSSHRAVAFGPCRVSPTFHNYGLGPCPFPYPKKKTGANARPANTVNQLRCARALDRNGLRGADRIVGNRQCRVIGPGLKWLELHVDGATAAHRNRRGAIVTLPEARAICTHRADF